MLVWSLDPAPRWQQFGQFRKASTTARLPKIWIQAPAVFSSLLSTWKMSRKGVLFFPEPTSPLNIQSLTEQEKERRPKTQLLVLGVEGTTQHISFPFWNEGVLASASSDRTALSSCTPEKWQDALQLSGRLHPRESWPSWKWSVVTPNVCATVQPQSTWLTLCATAQQQSSLQHAERPSCGPVAS